MVDFVLVQSSRNESGRSVVRTMVSAVGADFGSG